MGTSDSGNPLWKVVCRDRIDVRWLSETVDVLECALGRANLPAVDEQCDPANVANSLGFLQPTGEIVLVNPRLRPIEELQDYNEFI